jgi:hypothetical protein
MQRVLKADISSSTDLKLEQLMAAAGADKPHSVLG